MPMPPDLTVQQAIQRMQHDWVITRTVRPEDVWKVLGHPAHGVKIALPIRVGQNPHATSDRVRAKS